MLGLVIKDFATAFKASEEIKTLKPAYAAGKFFYSEIKRKVLDQWWRRYSSIYY